MAARPDPVIGSAGRPVRWAIVLAAALATLAIPLPGLPAGAQTMAAVFAGTIVGVIVQPIPGGAMVLLGVFAATFTGVLPVEKALSAYASPTVWLVLVAILMSRAMISTGLGRRIALHFVRLIGHHSLGLSYAMAATELVLASVIPSNGARSGGIVFPIASSIVRTYDSTPGPTARRLGAYLMVTLYQVDVIVCAMFLTGQASNLLIADFARPFIGEPISYVRWLVAGAVPGVVSLLVVPYLLYRWFPPEITETPGAAAYARDELARLGPIRGHERIMAGTFVLVCGLWLLSGWLTIHYTVVAFIGLAVLFITGVLTWDDVLAERTAWDIFIWYGGMIRLAEGINEYGITKRFAEVASSYTTGFPWVAALFILLVVYFYAHYGFASITAHVTSMFVPFVTLVTLAGAPPMFTVMAFACFANLSAALTHYGTTPAPIWFGAGYVSQATFWRWGLVTSIVTFTIWSTIGFAWWVFLGWA